MEPGSTLFQEDVGLYSAQLARLLRLHGDTAGAADSAAQSLAMFEKWSPPIPRNPYGNASRRKR